MAPPRGMHAPRGKHAAEMSVSVRCPRLSCLRGGGIAQLYWQLAKAAADRRCDAVLWAGADPNGCDTGRTGTNGMHELRQSREQRTSPLAAATALVEKLC